ncbi:MAG: ABC transporter ATP-binding protein [Devosia sp.]|nr:ABC transporter ATP-binding protein [Devosia sp.]
MADRHVVVDDLVKTYPNTGRPAVDHVSFSLERGQMLALLGPSGCGKTTILRAIAGLEAITSGAIRLDGADISTVPVYRRGMGMVFQAYALFPHMSVAENIAFGLEMRGIAKPERDARVARGLDLVKLTGLGDRRVNQLSGGQQQRAAIARSLVIEPALLLLDEPLSNLDAKLRDEMREEIRDIQARTGVTTIFVTHDQDEALSMADRVAVMSNGVIEQIGTPREVFDHPETEFVARFIGAGNFFTGRPITAGAAEIEGLGVLRFGGETPVKGEVRLMVRPHRFVLATSGATGVNQFAGVVEQLTYRGELLSLAVRVGPHLLQADVPTHAAALPEKGAPVSLAVAPADVTPIPGRPA